MKYTITTIAALLLTACATVATANNLTSLGVTPNGETAWRIESSATAPQTVNLRKAGGGSVAFIVNPGQTTVVIPGSTSGTYIAEFQSGNRASVTKASGPQIANLVPVNGKDGQDGQDGRDGADADTAALRSQMAADRGLAALQTRTAEAGQVTGSIGLSGTQDGVDAIAFGLRYGLSDRVDTYGVLSQSFDGSTSFGIGITAILGGN